MQLCPPFGIASCLWPRISTSDSVIHSYFIHCAVSAAAKGQQEITITAAQSHYCFEGLSPDSLYSATVFVQTPNLEGPGVSTKERTCKLI